MPPFPSAKGAKLVAQQEPGNLTRFNPAAFFYTHGECAGGLETTSTVEVGLSSTKHDPP